MVFFKAHAHASAWRSPLNSLKETTNLVTFLSVSGSELFSHWDEESVEVDDGIWRVFLMSFLIKVIKMVTRLALMNAV